MLTELDRRMDTQSKNFKKEPKNVKKSQLELKNTITEMRIPNEMTLKRSTTRCIIIKISKLNIKRSS